MKEFEPLPCRFVGNFPTGYGACPAMASDRRATNNTEKFPALHIVPKRPWTKYCVFNRWEAGIAACIE